jgi:hypothetical protein
MSKDKDRILQPKEDDSSQAQTQQDDDEIISELIQEVEKREKVNRKK